MRFFKVVALVCLVSSFTLAHENAINIKYVAVGDVPEETMNGIKETVNQHMSRIIKNFNVSKIPDITVKIWQQREAFELEYGEDAEYVQGYVVQSEWEARFFNGRPDLGLGVVHELTHLVTLALNDEFNNNPRWLWEATAIYESGRPPVPEVSELKCFSKHSFPTIESLNQHPFNIYKVGFYLTEFIVSKWGQDSLVKLVESNGDINTTLAVSVQDFEQMWLQFLKQKYNLVVSQSHSSDC